MKGMYTQHNTTHICQSVARGGWQWGQILTEEKAMRREQSVPDEAVNVRRQRHVRPQLFDTLTKTNWP